MGHWVIQVKACDPWPCDVSQLQYTIKAICSSYILFHLYRIIAIDFIGKPISLNNSVGLLQLYAVYKN